MTFAATEFTGQYRDRESALDYFNARYYSPQQGRFVSPDPQNAGAHPSNPQTWNAYAYVGNNPLNITDLNGESWWRTAIGIGIGIGSAFVPGMAPLGKLLGGSIGGWIGGATGAQVGAFLGPTILSSVTGQMANNAVGDLWGRSGPFGQTGLADYPWNEDHPALHRTPVDPLMIFTFQQWDKNGREILANGDVAIYGWLGNRGGVLKAAGERATHDMACAGLGFAVGGAGGALVKGGRPNAGFRSPVTGSLVGGSKAHAGEGISEGSSTISSALRDSRLGNAKIRGGRIYPAPRGYPWPGGGFGWTKNNRWGVLLGRWAPYVGAAGMAYGLYSLDACLSQ